MNSQLKVANSKFRSGNLHEALSHYKDCRNIFNNYPEIINNYIDQQIVNISTKLWPTQNPNVVVSACNSKYFNTLLLFLNSLLEWNSKVIARVYILDFGFEEWQVEILQQLRAKVELFRWNKSSVDYYPDYARFDIEDPSTYFFKVFAYHEARSIVSSSFPNTDVNLLWLDTGNLVQYPLNEVFSIIENESFFFIDHDDVNCYYDNPQNNLINILSPCLFSSSSIQLDFPTTEQLFKPYIKANFFGTKICNGKKRLLDLHRDICCQTDVLLEPRVIEGFENKNIWRKRLNLPRETGLYVNGRHEQTVWSYLAATNNIHIRKSQPFSYTTAAGSGTLAIDEYERRIRPKIERAYSSMRESMISFIRQHQETNIPFDANRFDKDSLIDQYLKLSTSVYAEKKVYMGIGFPPPQESRKSLVLLHRGAMTKSDQYKYSGSLLNHFDNIREDIFILLGNGPSLANVDFTTLESHFTFGLNAAYRGYERINFWPKFFGCFDALVCCHHSSKYKELVKESKISKFFFIDIDDKGDKIFSQQELNNRERFEDIRFQYRTPDEKQRSDILSISFRKFIDMRTSGANTIQSALLMGFRKIILLGVDQNYVEVVDGAAKDGGKYHKLIMEKTPDSNPNYWFSDYQQKGDKFNRPNLTISQIPAWHNLSVTLEDLKIPCMIYNCSPITQLKAFEKKPLDEALSKMQEISVSNLSAFKSPLKQEDRVFLI